MGTPSAPLGGGGSGRRIVRQDENGVLWDNGDGTKTLSLSAKPTSAVDKARGRAKGLDGKVEKDSAGRLKVANAAVPVEFAADGGAAKTGLVTVGEKGRRVRFGVVGARGGLEPDVVTVSRALATTGKELDPVAVPGDVASASARYAALPVVQSNSGPGRRDEPVGPLAIADACRSWG